MPFHSATLLMLVAAGAVLWWALRDQATRLGVLFVVSVILYGARHPPSVLLLLASIAFNFGWGHWLERRKSRSMLALGIAVNLSSLLYFKYAAFLAETLASVLAALGVSVTWAPPSRWLPLGISFFTFQVIAYLVDVYRGELKAERSLLVFAVFKSFFAQLVAGPIVRGHDMLPQLRARAPFRWEQLYDGLRLIIAGLFLKVGIADALAPQVNHAWADVGSLETSWAWLLMYGYSAELLADFCGYSTMAVGFGLIFGLTLPPNFLHPYGADSLGDFWRRWHVTLSSWLRDYLYIPLGGGRSHAGRNRFVTMLLGGLWHGAGWTFVGWGAAHGAAMALERTGQGDATRSRWRWLRVLVTFHFVSLAWVLFRAPDAQTGWAFFHRLFAPPWVWSQAVPTQFAVVTVVFLLGQRWWFAAFPLGPQSKVSLRRDLVCLTAMILWLIGYGSAQADFIYNVF